MRYLLGIIMKLSRTAMLAAFGLAAALSLTACNNGEDSAQAPAAKGPSSSSSSPSGGGTSSDHSSGSGGAQGGSAKPGSGTGSSSPSSAVNGGAESGGKTPFCKTQDLAIEASNAAPDQSSGRINITMVNRGSGTCSATGFAGVDIKDADHTSNPIERGQAQPRVTTLKPGDAAVFDLAYTIDGSGRGLAHPTDILVTPPNETHTLSLKWPAGAGGIKGAYTDVQVYPTHTTN
ncbi:DUF4232 domain-containing protein [Streptomyces sp. NPDC059761]|uniref:DUF4232 domain-containing protein n=1 Tax=Streptomyces sp. NPDC059761 TaxID=3346937 RepID=UPI00365D6601